MYPYDSEHLLKGTVERASVMGVLGTRGGFALVLFQRWGGGENVGKCAVLISAFETSS